MPLPPICVACHTQRPVRALSAALATAILLAGCGGALEGKKIDYKSASKLPPLEVPPDLAQPRTAGSRYTVPDAQAATYSEYEKNRAAQQPAGVATQDTILPASERVEMQRAGLQRWLVVKLPPEQVWLMVRDFWQESGFLLAQENPQIGYMETDWAESQPRVPVGGLTGLINKGLGFLSAMPERDKYRTRLERTADDLTEVFVSHKGMAEVYYRERENNTRWQVRPTDPELEVTMLSRLAVRLGAPEAKIPTLVQAADATPPRANVVRNDEGGAVVLADSFDRAWRRVGLALDRVGFMVEDRNRSEGIYFVKYQDPEAESPKKRGISKLAFWRSEEKKAPDQYRIQVGVPAGASGTEVRVLSQDGKPETGETGKRILSLLAEQLR
jgi:outer membrane protein assembly factor BamC